MDAEKITGEKEMIMEQMPKVSVCVLTYNPQKEKLIETLESIVRQKYANLQIILSDDGSEESFFNEAKEFLDNAHFTDYRLVGAPVNQGTVKNVEQALLAADGAFIKTISPGDCLTEDTILSDWMKHLIASGKQWSFSNAIYYSQKSDGVSTVNKRLANPQLVDCYTSNDNNTCRWNYVVLDDNALGAAILCERELMLRYIEQIVGAVKYVEDNIFRMMMFDGIVPDYFPEDAILYEYGSGISTSKSSLWAERMKEDWKAANRIILAKDGACDMLQQKMSLALKRRMNPSKILRNLARYAEKGRIHIMIQRRMHPRMTGGNEGEQLCK